MSSKEKILTGAVVFLGLALVLQTAYLFKKEALSSL